MLRRCPAPGTGEATPRRWAAWLSNLDAKALCRRPSKELLPNWMEYTSGTHPRKALSPVTQSPSSYFP